MRLTSAHTRPPLQVPTVRHRADPLASLRDIERPRDRMRWDPLAHLPSIRVPTDNSRYDPWVVLHRIEAPTARPAFDPLAHLASVQVPTVRFDADPLTHLRAVTVPSGVAALDPLLALLRVERPSDSPAWDPVQPLLTALREAPEHPRRPMFDAMSRPAAEKQPARDPLGSLWSVQRPRGVAAFDPLAHSTRSTTARKPAGRPGLDMVRGLIHAIASGPHKRVEPPQQPEVYSPTGLRYPVMRGPAVVDGVATDSRDDDVFVLPATLPAAMREH